jgi:hypothetical protein
VDNEDPDPFVPVWEGPYFEAEHLRVRLEAAHIPVDFGDALLTGHARVEVPRSYLTEVRDVLDGVQAHWPEVTRSTDDGFDWKPNLRLAFIAMALVVLLIIALAAF